jgi:hypothetical protein
MQAIKSVLVTAIKSATRNRSFPEILIDVQRVKAQLTAPARVLAHEIGHHIETLAGLADKEKRRPVTKAMRRFFPGDDYLLKEQGRDKRRRSGGVVNGPSGTLHDGGYV